MSTVIARKAAAIRACWYSGSPPGSPPTATAHTANHDFDHLIRPGPWPDESAGKTASRDTAGMVYLFGSIRDGTHSRDTTPPVHGLGRVLAEPIFPHLSDDVCRDGTLCRAVSSDVFGCYLPNRPNTPQWANPYRAERSDCGQMDCKYSDGHIHKLICENKRVLFVGILSSKILRDAIRRVNSAASPDAAEPYRRQHVFRGSLLPSGRLCAESALDPPETLTPAQTGRRMRGDMAPP